MRLPPVLKQSTRWRGRAAEGLAKAPTSGPGWLIRALSPEEGQPRQEAPVERSWPAAPCGDPTGEFTLRHPDLVVEGSLMDVPAGPARKRSRSIVGAKQGYFPSRKTARSPWSHSTLERDHMLVCELDPAVSYFIEQPAVLSYSSEDGSRRIARPDALVVREGRIGFVDVKYEERAGGPQEARWSAIGHALSGLGYGYEVMTERHIRQQPRWGRLNEVWSDRHAPEPDQRLLERAVAAVAREGTLAVGELVAACPGLDVRMVNAMIRNGLLAAARLGPPMVVAPPWAWRAFPERRDAL